MLLACGTPKGRLRISGHYENIKQGEFLLLSTDGGLDHVDTLYIRGGEFDYETDLTDDATFCIVYPNLSQLVLWAHSGDAIEIKGDAQDLWHVEVKGNEENELYTQFRQLCVLSDTLKLRENASSFIREHAASPVSQHLLCQYFVHTDDISQDSTMALYDVISKALPGNPQVATLGGLIRQRYVLAVGKQMPDFEVTTLDSTHHKLSHYAGKRLVLYFWAGWQGNGSVIHRELAAARDKIADKSAAGTKVSDGTVSDKVSSVKSSVPVALLGYSLDVDTLSFNLNKPSEERRIPTALDLQGFTSPLVSALGIRHIPTFVVVGPTGKVELLSHDLGAVTTALSSY